MNGIRIVLSKLDEGDDRFCRSKWWGDPDMPVDFDYPGYTDKKGNLFPYNFICQIRLEELVAAVGEFPELPSRGMLYFFGKIDYFLDRPVLTDEMFGCTVWPKGAVKVIYIEDVVEENFRSKEVVVGEERFNFNPLNINFVPTKECEILTMHQLLGEPFGYPYERWDRPCGKWKLLFQLDSDEGEDFRLNFMDCGLLYFLISPEDLQKRDFSKVRGVMESS